MYKQRNDKIYFKNCTRPGHKCVVFISWVANPLSIMCAFEFYSCFCDPSFSFHTQIRIYLFICLYVGCTLHKHTHSYIGLLDGHICVFMSHFICKRITKLLHKSTKNYHNRNLHIIESCLQSNNFMILGIEDKFYL